MTGEDETVDVLIVEDNADMATLYASWLRPAHGTEVANDCATAYERLAESIDVVVLDRHLPDGTGREVLEHVRDMADECRVVVVSAVTPDLDVVDMDFDDYLTKPASKDELLATVARLCSLDDYDADVQELYPLAVTQAYLEANCSSTELAASERYADLLARIDELAASVAERADDGAVPDHPRLEFSPTASSSS